jgi:hypothetical protein
MGKSNKTISRRAGRLGLFPAVGFALGAGLAVAVAAYGFLHWIMPASEAKAAPIDITRVSLTIVAGVGGVVALVIAYRLQRFDVLCGYLRLPYDPGHGSNGRTKLVTTMDIERLAPAA